MLQQFIATFGLPLLAGLIFFESAGLPLPGETTLLLAAAAAAQGLLPIWAVVLVATVAAIAGDSLGYWVGSRYGLPLLTRYGRWLHISPAHLDQAQAFMQRHGPPTVFFGRFVALLRVLAAFLAGVCRMPYRQFLRYNALGGLVWATTIGALGYLFGQQLPLLERLLRQVGWGAAALALALIVSVVGWRRWQRRRETVREVPPCAS
jgi:membrane protein DedA with SNARE-associated domain